MLLKDPYLTPNSFATKDFMFVSRLLVNCLDVHTEKHSDRVALIWERDEPATEVKVTYRYEHLISNLHHRERSAH